MSCIIPQQNIRNELNKVNVKDRLRIVFQSTASYSRGGAINEIISAMYRKLCITLLYRDS